MAERGRHRAERPRRLPGAALGHGAAGGALSGSGRTTWVILRRNLLKSRRTPLLIAFSLLQPIIWLLLFTQIFKRLADVAGFQALGYDSYLTFFTPSMVVFTMLFSALQSGLSMVTDLDTGMLDKLLISPIGRWSILVGRLLADGARMVAQGAIVLVLGLLMGAQMTGGVPGAVLVVALGTAFGMGWAALSVFVALHTRSAELTMAAGFMLTLPVLFLSSAFFPKQLLPGWLQTATDVNPAARVIEAARSVMTVGVDGTPMSATLLALALLALLTTGAATLAFRMATS